MFYHVTNIEYEIGSSVHFPPNTQNHYSQQTPYSIKVEKHIESYRPKNSNSRITSFYAFDDYDTVCDFALSQEQPEKYTHVYKVALKNPTGHPMNVASYITKHFNLVCENIVKEYWIPTKEWEVTEYLSTEMTIIEKLPIIDCEGYLLASIQFDFPNAGKLCS